jgi:uncharacterized membrane protein
MSDDSTISMPKKGLRWWKALLVASLALNLLIGGAVATRLMIKDRPDRITGANYTQLIPRSFFAEMPRERRRELLDILKKYRDEFRTGREASKQIAVKLADAIDVEPYDIEKAKLVVKEFADQNGKLVSRGGDAVIDVLAVLTPEERKSLANVIRERPMNRK